MRVIVPTHVPPLVTESTLLALALVAAVDVPVGVISSETSSLLPSRKRIVTAFAASVSDPELLTIDNVPVAAGSAETDEGSTI